MNAVAEAWFNLDAFLATGMVGVSTGTCWVGAKGCLEEEVGYTLGVKEMTSIIWEALEVGSGDSQPFPSLRQAGRQETDRTLQARPLLYS